MAALARLYAQARDGPPAGRATPMIFWLAMGVATLVKGPVGPMVAALAMVSLAVADRRPGWLGRLNWYWGLILFLIIVGPWAGAVTVATDGGFWSKALAGDLAPKLAGGQESHGAPPGYHTLLAPLLLFPATLLLPAALVTAWRRRKEPGVRFALAWLIPTWLVFELLPTKLVHYTLPAYGAICWLAAAALVEPLGKRVKIAGAVLAGLFGLLLAAAAFYLLSLYGDGAAAAWAILAAALLAAAGLAGAYMLLKRETPLPAVAAAVGFGLLGHAALAAGLAPRLGPLWLSRRIEAAMGQAQLLPRQGIADAPVAVAGYAEPSLVFALGTETELGGPQDAADAIAEHRPAVVEARADPAFRQALATLHAKALEVAEVRGLDYSDGHKMTLRIYKAPDTEGTQAQGAQPQGARPQGGQNQGGQP
jgi:4-amino-4-deoxy-L-arabinose transferase-like glycosyltransferase